MDLKLAGKRAAVAAASKGLGFGAAAALAAEGVTVAMCGRDEGRITEAAARVGRNAIPLIADVSRPDGADAFIAAATDALGGVDILVTNAGGPTPGTFATTPTDSYPDALDLNLISVVAMCKAAVPAMQKQAWGRVVAITSISVRQPLPHLILSNTARAGATAFLKTLATEVAPDGVTVNSVQPGLHATERLTQLYGGDMDAAAKSVPARKLGDAADFGSIVAFLCSDAAKFITGTAIPVDGGSAGGLQ
ncbi:MAG TPA: SDR family oxidoreductase [Acidimicrobiales bacterium]|nr:SDR family oxidoreductase [Acidimicrobiales bacterium]